MPAATNITDKLFKQFMQAYLAAQTSDQDTGPYKQLLKPWFPHLYFENL